MIPWHSFLLSRECLWVKPPLVLRLSSFLIHSFSLIMAWTSLGFSGWCLLLEEYLFENISTAKTVNLLLKMSQWTLFLLGPQIKAIFRCSKAWFASSRKFKDFFFFFPKEIAPKCAKIIHYVYCYAACIMYSCIFIICNVMC